MEVLPPDGSTIGNLSDREALSRVAGRPVGEQKDEAVKTKALALGRVVKGRGRGRSIGLADGIEDGGRHKAPSAVAAGNGRGREKKDATAKDFKAVLWASADKLRAQMDAAEYKHLVLGLIFLKSISDTFAERRVTVLAMLRSPDSDFSIVDDPADHEVALEENMFWVPADA